MNRESERFMVGQDVEGSAFKLVSEVAYGEVDR